MEGTPQQTEIYGSNTDIMEKLKSPTLPFKNISIIQVCHKTCTTWESFSDYHLFGPSVLFKTLSEKRSLGHIKKPNNWRERISWFADKLDVVRMKEQWGPEELAEEEPWNSQAFRSMSRRQQNLEIYKVSFSKHVSQTEIFTITLTGLAGS